MRDETKLFNNMDGMTEDEVFDILDEELDCLIAGDLDAYIKARLTGELDD